ncbi:hypothetical protein SCA6_018491 [Theobroma cacao]
MMSSSEFASLSRLLVFLCLALQYFKGTDSPEQGQSITFSKTVISAGMKFELGFFSPRNSSRYYVGIWFKFKVSTRTVVWVANREYPFLRNTSIFAINPDGNIVISDGRISHMLTNRTTSGNTYAMLKDSLHARLLDSGNLTLHDQISLEVLWQSFNYPSDTILPGMNLGNDRRYGVTWSVVSWRNADDPAPECPTGPVVLYNRSAADCESVCWHSCSCVAYSNDHKLGCLVWNGDFFDLKQLSEKSIYGKIFYLKLAASELVTIGTSSTNGTRKDSKNKSNKWLLWTIGILTVSLSMLTLGLFIHCLCRKSQYKGEDLLTFDLASSVNGDDRDLTEANEPNEPGTPMMRDVKLPFFSFSSVSAATNNFSATIKVGEGGFGAMQWRRSI